MRIEISKEQICPDRQLSLHECCAQVNLFKAKFSAKRRRFISSVPCLGLQGVPMSVQDRATKKLPDVNMCENNRMVKLKGGIETRSALFYFL